MRNILLAILVFPLMAHAGTLRGTVRDSLRGKPIEDATVIIGGLLRLQTTDAQGNFLVKDIPPGKYLVTVSAYGFDHGCDTLVIRDTASDTVLNFSLIDPRFTFTERSAALARSFAQEPVGIFRDSMDFVEACQRRPDLRRMESLSHATSGALYDSLGAMCEFAIDSLIPKRFSNNHFAVGFRMRHSLILGLREYSFVFAPTREGEGVYVFEADSFSLRDQITLLLLDKPEIPRSELMARLRVRSWRFTTDEIPDLEVLMNSVTKVTFSTPEDGIFLDPPFFEVEYRAGGGNLSATFTDIGSPLVQWALHVKRTLDAYRH